MLCIDTNEISGRFRSNDVPHSSDHGICLSITQKNLLSSNRNRFIVHDIMHYDKNSNAKRPSVHMKTLYIVYGKIMIR